MKSNLARKVLPNFKSMGIIDYQKSLASMQKLTQQRTTDSPDEIWFLEHPPVYTLGANADHKHILTSNSIPKIKCDRGGQVTYHGPGQLICYLMIDLRRMSWSIHDMVNTLEQLLIELLKQHHITGHTIANKRGVFVSDEKIASIGLRFKKYCSYHGFALNIDMDLEPFNHINPCGYANQSLTQMKAWQPDINMTHVSTQLQNLILHHFYTISAEQ